jgi:hypothetical protein
MLAMLARVVALLLAFSLLAGSADIGDSHSWSSLRELAPGTPVEIVTSAGKTINGSYVSYSEDSLKVRTKKQEVSLARTDVVRVRRRAGSKATWIGAGLGAGSGAGIGYAGGNQLHNTSGGDLGSGGGFAALGAGAGALAGALIGHFVANRHTAVYKAK